MPHSSRQPMPVRVAASQNRVFTLTQASAPPPLPPTRLSLSALQMAQQIRVLEFLSMIKFKHDTSLAALQQQAFLRFICVPKHVLFRDSGRGHTTARIHADKSIHLM